MAGALSEVEGQKTCLDDAGWEMWAEIREYAVERFAWRVFA